MATTIELNCTHCGVSFNKEVKEITRQQKRGRENFFCSNSCGAVFQNQKPVSVRANIASGKRLAKFVTTNPKLMAKAARSRENWKYESVRKVLKRRQIAHIFEYPLVTDKGSIRIFDLALRDSRTLVEFDGDYHQRNGLAYNKRDAQKEKLAKRRGWKLVRVIVPANTVIKSNVLSHLIV